MTKPEKNVSFSHKFFIKARFFNIKNANQVIYILNYKVVEVKSELHYFLVLTFNNI